MSLPFEDAAEILISRQASDSLLKRQMIAIRDRYNGDWVVPLVDVEDEPTIDPPIPALISDAIDQIAMRACSTKPQINVPAMDPSGPRSVIRASKRRKAYYATWYHSHLQLLQRRWTRHLVGYGTNCVVAMPDFKTSLVKFEVRDPLTAYPDDSSPEEVRLPANIGFIYPRSPDWIAQTWGNDAKEYVSDWHTDLWDVFEWMDEDNIYLGILGPRHQWGEGYATNRGYVSGKPPKLLRAWPNRAGVVTGVCPGRVTMDRIAGQMTKMVGLVDMMAKLMALEVIAAEKGVFADKYLMSKMSGETITITGGEWKDGRSGQINIVQGADAIGELQHPLQPTHFNVVDRVERAIRMSSGNSGIFGGELTGAIRSGSTITQAGSYAIDPRVQEVQEMNEYQLSALNVATHEIFKGYWPNKKYTIFSGWHTDKGYVEFEPSKDFEGGDNVVSYAFTGADISQLTVALAQAQEARLIPRRQAQRMHPLVENPDDAEHEIIEQALVDAVLESFLVRMQNGTLAEIDVLEALRVYRSTGDIIDAVVKANESAQKRQAAALEQPQDPNMAAPPGAMPGMSPAGTAGMEGQPAGPQGQAGIDQFLAAIAGGQG